MKPNDISQSLWDRVYEIQKSYDERDGWNPTPWDVERVCRFVMAEREACAEEMDRRWRENANTPETRAAYQNAAAAIRGRD